MVGGVVSEFGEVEKLNGELFVDSLFEHFFYNRD